jgi:alpha-L-fucosidase
MAVNAEAIYGTQAVAPYKQGRVCVTQKKDGTLYVIYLAAEGQSHPPAEIGFPALQPADRAELVMLGSETKLAWREAEQGFRVAIPPALREHPPCQHAWTIRISPPAN